MIQQSITTNKFNMEYATEFSVIKGWNNENISGINHIKICKKCCLPCELVGMSSN